MGDRLARLREAVRQLAALPGVRILGKSRIYETEPLEVPEAYRGLAFLNAVVIVEWPGTARGLLDAAHAIEAAAGRVRTGRNEPRPLDVDIVYAGSGATAEPGLTVPHPRWMERRFVLEPLAELRPDLAPPGSRRTVREALAALPPQGARLCEESL